MASDLPATTANSSGRNDSLSTMVKLTVGQMFFLDAHGKRHHCAFQFNPTEIERSRTVQHKRTPTGNILEEPRFGPRNQAKRKFTRKPDPWTMTLTLRFDASRPLDASDVQSPLPENAAKQLQNASDAPIEPPKATAAPSPPPAAPPPHLADRIDAALRFFEGIVEAVPFTDESQRIVNADETPPPPTVVLALGPRAWNCAVKSVRIKEQDYTIDLYPRRFEVTLDIELIETIRQNEYDQTGSKL
jgi:hypothetical protein